MDTKQAVRASANASGAQGESRSQDELRSVRRIGWALLGLQLVAMLAFSAVQYSRFALTRDFAAYSQAMWAISHGHLDPYSTVLGTTFWRNNAEFVIWPLSLLYRLYPHPILILFVQDLVVVITELVAFEWILELLRARPKSVSSRAAKVIAIGAAIALMANPFAFETIAFDFHTHVFATLFLVLAGRDLWAGRFKRLWIWVPLVLLSNAPGAFYLAGLGLAGILAGRRTRRVGALLGVTGLGWFLLISATGADGAGGQIFASWYGYLAGSHRGHVGLFDVLFGALRHPQLVGHMLAKRWLLIFDYLVVVGLLGIVSPWGFGVSLFVFGPNLLASTPTVIRFQAAFQSWPALLFLLVGSCSILLWLVGNYQRLTVALVACWAVCAGLISIILLAALPSTWIAVDASAASQMARLQSAIPLSAEVVASNGVVGRLAGRESVEVLGWGVYSGESDRTTVPISAPEVFFIITPQQGVGENRPFYRSAITYLQSQVNAKLIVEHAGVFAFEWKPPPGTKSLTIL